MLFTTKPFLIFKIEYTTTLTQYLTSPEKSITYDTLKKLKLCPCYGGYHTVKKILSHLYDAYRYSPYISSAKFEFIKR